MELRADNHHVFFERRKWLMTRTTSQIRNHALSQILLPVEIHRELHANTHSIALPTEELAKMILYRTMNRRRQYKPLDNVKDIYEWTGNIFEQYTDAIPIHNRLGEQLPYLHLGEQALKRKHVA